MRSLGETIQRKGLKTIPWVSFMFIDQEKERRWVKGQFPHKGTSVSSLSILDGIPIFTFHCKGWGNEHPYFSSLLILLPLNLMLFAIDNYFSFWIYFLRPTLIWTHPFYLNNCYPSICFYHISRLSLYFLGSHVLLRSLMTVQFLFLNRCSFSFLFFGFKHLEFSVLLNVLKLHEAIMEWDVFILRLLSVFLAVGNTLVIS